MPPTVTCKRCQLVREVHPWSLPFRYWVCDLRRSKTRTKCWTLNEVPQ